MHPDEETFDIPPPSDLKGMWLPVDGKPLTGEVIGDAVIALVKHTQSTTYAAYVCERGNTRHSAAEWTIDEAAEDYQRMASELRAGASRSTAPLRPPEGWGRF